MVFKTVYHFDDSNLLIEISSKKEGNKITKKDGVILDVVLPERGQMTYLGEGRVCLGDQG